MSRKISPKISIVVPFHNVEAYFEECLESLARQTLRDLEVIMVDDGSPERRGAGDQEHVLGRKDDHPQQHAEAGGPPAEPVDPDPLSTGRSGRTPHDGNLQHVGAGPALDAREVGAPPHELAIRARAVRAPPGEQHHGLEQARLAGGVRSPDQMRNRTERHVEGRIPP